LNRRYPRDEWKKLSSEIQDAVRRLAPPKKTPQKGKQGTSKAAIKKLNVQIKSLTKHVSSLSKAMASVQGEDEEDDGGNEDDDEAVGPAAFGTKGISFAKQTQVKKKSKK